MIRLVLVPDMLMDHLMHLFSPSSLSSAGCPCKFDLVKLQSGYFWVFLSFAAFQELECLTEILFLFCFSVCVCMSVLYHRHLPTI